MRKRFKLKAGDTRTFELESHEGGGYLWSVVSNDECIKVQLSKKTPSKGNEKQPLGKSFPVLVEIKALSEGQRLAAFPACQKMGKMAHYIQSVFPNFQSDAKPFPG